MSTKKPHKKKRKFKFKKFTLFILTIALIILLAFTIITFKIKNFYITGNQIYNDYQILTIAKLNNYPPFITTSTFLAELKLKNNKLIKSAIIKKSLWATVNIEITEYQPYFFTSDNILILEGGREVRTKDLTVNIDAPILTTIIKDTLRADLIKAFAKIKPEIITKISEVEYKPSLLDKERFLFLMTDGNYSYVTLTNMENINYYNKIVTQLAGKKGIINFDSYRDSDAGITIDILNQ